MADNYDTIADTRPRVRRDLLFTETPDGVLFHNAQGGFHVNSRTAYRFAKLIVPFLNGEHRVEDICAALGPAQRTMVTELVNTLYDRGFARNVPAKDPAPAELAPAVRERFAAQIAYVDHYADGAEERFARFRATRVAIVGDDRIARWAALGLVRNGCGTVGVSTVDTEVADEVRALTAAGVDTTLSALDGAGLRGWQELSSYDVVVVTGGPAAPRQVVRLLAAGVPEGVSVIPAWTFGNRAVVGPRTTDGHTACWSCAALRLGVNSDAAAAADLWSGIYLADGTDRPGRRPSRPLAAMLGNLLAYEVFRIATGALPGETTGKVVVQDLDSLDVTSEPLLPHPACSFCTPPAVDVDHAVTPAVPQTSTVESASAGEALVEELNKRLVLVRPNVGVFTGFTDEPWTQTPLKVSTLTLATGHGARREIAAFDIHHVAGARMRALHTAATVYLEHAAPLSTVDGTGDTPRIDPDSPVTASGIGGAAGEPGAWVAATSLHDGREVLVPAGAVRTFGGHNAARRYVPTSAGAGAGASAAEAIGDGLLSAVSYAAVRAAVRGTGPVSALDPATVADDPELTFLLRSAGNLDVEVELLDLTAVAPAAHVVLAREKGGDRWAVRADVAWRGAASAALRDLLGAVQLGRQSGTAVDTGDPLVGDLAPGAIAVTAPALDRGGAVVSWDTVLADLVASGHEAFVVRTARPDLMAGRIVTAHVVLGVRDVPARGAR